MTTRDKDNRKTTDEAGRPAVHDDLTDVAGGCQERRISGRLDGDDSREVSSENLAAAAVGGCAIRERRGDPTRDELTGVAAGTPRRVYDDRDRLEPRREQPIE